MSTNGKDLGPGRGELTPEEAAALRKRAGEIGKRLDDVKARNAPAATGPAGGTGKGFGEAFKIVADLLVGVAAGGGIGWFLDRQLGTTPWLLILFLMLGFGAGLSNVIRTARQMQAEAEPLQRSAAAVKDDDDDDDPVKQTNRR